MTRTRHEVESEIKKYLEDEVDKEKIDISNLSLQSIQEKFADGQFDKNEIEKILEKLETEDGALVSKTLKWKIYVPFDKVSRIPSKYARFIMADATIFYIVSVLIVTFVLYNFTSEDSANVFIVGWGAWILIGFFLQKSAEFLTGRISLFRNVDWSFLSITIMVFIILFVIIVVYAKITDETIGTGVLAILLPGSITAGAAIHRWAFKKGIRTSWRK